MFEVSGLRGVILLSAALGLFPAAVQPAAVVEIETFFLPAGFLAPSELLSDSGRVAWSGAFDCTPDCQSGVFQVGGPGGFLTLAAQGDAAQGFGAGFELGQLRQATDVAWNGWQMAAPFELVDTNTASVDYALWMGIPGALQALAVANDQVPDPDLSGVFFGGFARTIRLNRAGTTCFGSRLYGSGITTANDDVLWCGTPGNVEIRLREGDPAPGRPPGETLVGLEESHPSNNVIVGPFALSSAGEVLITAQTESGLGLWLAGTNGTILLAFEGQEALSSGLLYSGLKNNGASFGGLRDVAFHTLLEGGTVNAVLGGFPDTPRIVAKSGDPAPPRPGGDPNGGTYVAPGFVAVNAWGQVLFQSRLVGHPTADLGLYAEIGVSGSVVPILLAGDAAPGTDPGVTFSGGVSVAYFNASRQVAFKTLLAGSASSANDDSVWIWDPDEGPVLVAREGQVLEVAPADERIVRTVRLLQGGLYDGWRQSFNERGEVVLFVTFFDDSAALVKARLTPKTIVFDDGFESGDLSSWSAAP